MPSAALRAVVAKERRASTTNVVSEVRGLGDTPCARRLGTVTPADPSTSRGIYLGCGTVPTMSLARPLPATAVPSSVLDALFGALRPEEVAAGFEGPTRPATRPRFEIGTFGDVAVVDFTTPLPSNLTGDDQGSNLLYANVGSATGHRRVSILVGHTPMCQLNETCG